MDAVLEVNLFPNSPPNRTVAIFFDVPLPADTIAKAIGIKSEEIRLGTREIYVRCASGMADSELKIPAVNGGTARNMNTVARLAAMSAKR